MGNHTGFIVLAVIAISYIFQRREITHSFILSLADRARTGVDVDLLMDALGSQQ